MAKGRRPGGGVKAQGWLPFIPEDLARLGLAGCNRAPLCSRGRSAGFLDVLRRPGPVAWAGFPHVQHHGTNDYTGVYLDVDRPVRELVEAVDDGTVPHPSVALTRTESGHSHCAWLLAQPVHRHPKARTGPLNLFARTAEYFADVLGADPGYTSVLFRNGPLHVEREGWVVTYGGPPGGWTLYELADWIPKGWRRPRPPATAEGRNCSLFMALCRFAGTSAGRTADLAIEAEQLNGAFAWPLPQREVAHVVSRSRDTAQGGNPVGTVPHGSPGRPRVGNGALPLAGLNGRFWRRRRHRCGPKGWPSTRSRGPSIGPVARFTNGWPRARCPVYTE